MIVYRTTSNFAPAQHLPSEGRWQKSMIFVGGVKMVETRELSTPQSPAVTAPLIGELLGYVRYCS